MMTPQLTEQYGQVDRVSVVLAIFSSRACACATVTSKPRTVVATPPIDVIFRKSRRVAVTSPPGKSDLIQEKKAAAILLARCFSRQAQIENLFWGFFL